MTASSEHRPGPRPAGAASTPASPDATTDGASADAEAPVAAGAAAPAAPAAEEHAPEQRGERGAEQGDDPGPGQHEAPGPGRRDEPGLEPREAPRPEPDPLAAERARTAEYLALAQRTQADFENYRKRTAREAAAAEGRGVGRLARELLPALDNLALALAAADSEGEGAGHLAEGIRLVQSELFAALRRAGIDSFSPEGERFDPALHEAMASMPAEGVEPGTVIEVYQRGYRHRDTVLRPARVVVSAAAA